MLGLYGGSKRQIRVSAVSGISALPALVRRTPSIFCDKFFVALPRKDFATHISDCISRKVTRESIGLGRFSIALLAGITNEI